MTGRPVDRAVAGQPAKDTVRRLWLEVVETELEAHADGGEPIYLTLPGAEGHDISTLEEAGVFSRAESGAIHEQDLWKVVAVESSLVAATSLQGKFPGLNVLRKAVQELVRGTGPVRWPEGEDTKFCRARVVNLDFDSPLHATVEHDQVMFPALRVVSKIAQIHAVPPVDWSLCLTFNATLVTDAEASDAIQAFLAENIRTNAVFSDGCRTALGDPLYEKVSAESADLAALSRDEAQKLLMAFIPKRIAEDTCGQGWRVETTRNLLYSGGGGAPMVTWILKFHWDPRTAGRGRLVCEESVSTTFQGAGQIAQDGSIS